MFKLWKMNEEFFENEVLDLHLLPEVESLDFVPIEKSYVNVLYISYSIFFVILVAIFAIVLLPRLGFLNWLSWFILLGIFGLYVLLLWFGSENVKRKQYVVRNKDISYKTGVFFKDWITVPFNRVQHCEITKGVLENAFGLVSLKIFTAGGSGSDLYVPGLKPEIAHQLKEYVIGKIKHEDEEE